MANKEGELGQSELPLKMVPEPPRPLKSFNPATTEGGAKVPPTVPPVAERAETEWPTMMEEALNSSPIVEEHRALMGTGLQSIRSIDNGVNEAFGILLMVFKVNHVIPFYKENLFYRVMPSSYIVAPKPWVSLKNSCGGRIV